MARLEGTGLPRVKLREWVPYLELRSGHDRSLHCRIACRVQEAANGRRADAFDLRLASPGVEVVGKVSRRRDPGRRAFADGILWGSAQVSDRCELRAGTLRVSIGGGAPSA